MVALESGLRERRHGVVDLARWSFGALAVLALVAAPSSALGPAALNEAAIAAAAAETAAAETAAEPAPEEAAAEPTPEEVEAATTFSVYGFAMLDMGYQAG